MPSFATAAALLLIFLLVPKLLSGTEYSFDSAETGKLDSEEKISLSEDELSESDEKRRSADQEQGIFRRRAQTC